MFRKLYKQANEEIKGNREILDRAFLKAAQPEAKKSAWIKYSAVGTAVAAVVVLGAVFLNFSIFENKSEGLKEPAVYEAENERTPEKIAEVENAEDDNAEEEKSVAEQKSGTEGERSAPKAKAKGAMQAHEKHHESAENAKETQMQEAEKDAVSAAEFVEEVQSVKTEDAPEAWENGNAETETQMMRGALGRAVCKDEETEDNENTSGSELFSYMYDMSLCEEDECKVVSEGFENTEVSPLDDGEGAELHAANECGFEYVAARVFYDSAERVWKVTFFDENGDEPVMAVYMNEDGITLKIVYFK